MTPLQHQQKEARKAFWSLDEQEPQDYDRFLNGLVARVYAAALDSVESGLPKEDKTPDADELERADRLAWNACRAVMLSHLRTLREGITGNV